MPEDGVEVRVVEHAREHGAFRVLPAAPRLGRCGNTTAYYTCADYSAVGSVAFSTNGATVALGCWSSETTLYRTTEGLAL
jgi:hypothetical protein